MLIDMVAAHNVLVEVHSFVGETRHASHFDMPRGRPGRIIPVLPPIILLFYSPEISHYSHHLVPIILDYSGL